VDVFVSHASADASIAEAIVSALERGGTSCWIAPRNIPPGVAYGDGIMAGLRSCRVLVVVLSAHAVASPHVLRELERAIHHRLVIVPFRIDATELTGSFEFFLSLPHWIDADPPTASHLERLLEAVHRILDVPVEPAAGPARPEACTPQHVEEISPDEWSRRRPGSLRQFLARFLRDPGTQ
jgi:hypothetical protein